MNMINVEVKDSHRLINAGSLILVSVSYEEEKTVTPIAWHAPISGTPKLVGVALAKKHFSTELIQKAGSYCINIPILAHLEDVKYCGKVSGRDVDKFSESAFAGETCTTIDNLYVAQCPARLECAVEEIISLGDHNLIVGEVKGAFCADDFLTEENTIDVKKYQVIQHLGGNDFGTIVIPESL